MICDMCEAICLDIPMHSIVCSCQIEIAICDDCYIGKYVRCPNCGVTIKDSFEIERK